jgi:hypothetical protein
MFMINIYYDSGYTKIVLHRLIIETKVIYIKHTHLVDKLSWKQPINSKTERL